jgi:uncharacterized membrane protein YedE/YeeE
MMLLERCPWYIAGPSLGLLLILFRAALNKPFGAMGGFIALVERTPGRPRFGVSIFVLAGTILGGAIFAVASGRFSPTLGYAAGGGFLPAEPVVAFVVLLAAGAVMGFGARLAGGCTSGHGLTGMSLGSPASIAATLTFMTTAVVLANAVAWLIGRAS